MEKAKRKVSRPAQIILVLRLAAGIYLVYLAFDLVKDVAVSSGSRQLIQIACMLLYGIAGVILAGWTAKKLLRREFTRQGEVAEPEDDIED